MAHDRVLDPVIAGSGRIGAFGHGFTGGGHPVAAAVALETWRIIGADGPVERAARTGAPMQARLRGGEVIRCSARCAGPG